jgi:hypothetical protein
MAATSKSDAKAGASDVAAYVATMARELKVMVDATEMVALGYLLELVRLEAEARAEDESNRFAQAGSRR